MKKINVLLQMAFIGFLLVSVSCSVENEPILTENFQNPTPKPETAAVGGSESQGVQRSVSYKLSGNFSGKLDITFLSSDGFTPPSPFIGMEIPWETDYDIPEHTYAIGGYANGLYGDGKPEETASLQMFLDDRLLETVIRTADEDGYITLPLESYSLEYDTSEKTISDSNIGKEITYKVDGDFSGKLILVYRIADGSRENIQINALPWEYTFETTVNSARVSIYGFGTHGMKNEKIQYSLSLNGTTIDSGNVEAYEDGSISLTPEFFIDFD